MAFDLATTRMAFGLVTTRMAFGLATARVAVRLAAGAAAARLKRGPDLARRLAALPLAGAPVRAPVAVHWAPYAIPFVEAESEADALAALGVVHAHLRLTQMEIMRHLAWGRTAELLGPAAVELDHALRILDFPRAVPAWSAALPAATRRLTESFVAGVNHVARHAPPPPEFAMLGLKPRDWSLADVLAVGRLASADANWLILFHLLRLRGRDDWPELWRHLMEQEGAAGRTSAEPARSATLFGRLGSNALAVSAAKSASGAALLACDPHLNLMLPNIWLAAGVEAPGLNCAGLMIPGLPFFAIGRNRRIAWTGTCLQAASSELFDARRLAMAERVVAIRARHLHRPERRVVRETRLGPVITDSPLLAGEQPVALSWVGHRPGDDLTAMMRMNRADGFARFLDAADMLSVPGQTMVYADVDGHVAKLPVAHLPRRPDHPPGDLVLPPEQAWDGFVSARALPRVVDPPEGFVVSANERPEGAALRIGLFFPPADRYRRMTARLAATPKVSSADIKALHLDVRSDSAAELAAWMAERGLELVRGWDGSYHAESRQAAAFELALAGLHRQVHGRHHDDAWWASWNPVALLRTRLDEAVPPALSQAPEWGELHRLRLGHPLSLLPGLGRLLGFCDLPAPGGNETLMKTAHGLTQGRHAVRFGANARLIAHLSDLDATSVVLLGGQDGWLGSANFMDQLEPWRRGAYLPLPLRAATARARAVATTVLSPGFAPAG